MKFVDPMSNLWFPSAVARQGGSTERPFGFWVFPGDNRSSRSFFCPDGTMVFLNHEKHEGHESFRETH